MSTLKNLMPSTAKRGVLGSVIVLLILTALELPPPIGFETRPQADVAAYWGLFFVIVLVVEIATIPIIYIRPSVGGGLGILAAVLNILLALADQAHLLQPEVAPFGYSVLEGMAVITSLALAYFSWAVRQPARMSPGASQEDRLRRRRNPKILS